MVKSKVPTICLGFSVPEQKEYDQHEAESMRPKIALMILCMNHDLIGAWSAKSHPYIQ